MNFWRSVEGMIAGELTGADPGDSLSVISRSGICLTQVIFTEDLTVRFRCSAKDWRSVREICRRRGDTLRLLEETGWISVCRRISGRPLLVMGILFFLILSMVIPTRVLFFSVEGNEQISSRQILAAAENCGIRFGVSRRSVRSEKMKNALLRQLPELKWAGINTAGCTAVISVRERQPQQENQTFSGVGSIVAARDGYITSCTVTRGSSLCAPGQVVKAGQMLISGYTDCGICLQVTRAEGEVYAETSHEYSLLTPSEAMIRVGQGQCRRRYSLILGKKRINFWKDSGISDGTCGRMYEEYYITLPGGFRLPLCLAVETLTDRELETVPVLPEELADAMKACARNGVLKQTIAGKILGEDHTASEEGGSIRMDSRFVCREMIGRVITEEIGEANGKTD